MYELSERLKKQYLFKNYFIIANSTMYNNVYAEG
jgi:hypothetical protein